ncbi:helix-turn-helix domain-containing protein [Pseudogemmobacter faecipullorum]|uniref:Helix-turn-helix domain-containing protein n=1 Tax=Pseudogemmobacter faecipullorum TaxID=2755041 RepID=A0ABS8CUB4_9RHOB|nr:helix-turn-helix domain-containing protein [Pseudogemmobacter faecipullorum]MCB5412415.1 helix-turn-helix domain-containing protein [Pseudogemmobacter faecipullorum]
MRLSKNTLSSSSDRFIGESKDGVATLFVETKKQEGLAWASARRLRGKAKPSFSSVAKEHAEAKQAPAEVMTWLDSVVEDGSGVIVVRTASGLHRLSVRSLDDKSESGALEPEMDGDVAKAVARAQQRGRETAASVLNHPDMLTGEDIAQRMGMSRQAVYKATITNKLFALEGAKRGYRYPLWQIDEAGVRHKGLQEVISLVGNGWEALRFFSASADGIFNRERLGRGDVEGLLAQARLWNSSHYG